MVGRERVVVAFESGRRSLAIALRLARRTSARTSLGREVRLGRRSAGDVRNNGVLVHRVGLSEMLEEVLHGLDTEVEDGVTPCIMGVYISNEDGRWTNDITSVGWPSVIVKRVQQCAAANTFT